MLVGGVLIYLGGRMLWRLSDADHPHSRSHHDHGSGALVIALASAAPTVSSPLSFLLTFSLLSIATMIVVPTVWGRTLNTPFTAYLEGLAGLLGIGFGHLLLVEQVAGIDVF